VPVHRQKSASECDLAVYNTSRIHKESGRPKEDSKEN